MKGTCLEIAVQAQQYMVVTDQAVGVGKGVRQQAGEIVASRPDVHSVEAEPNVQRAVLNRIDRQVVGHLDRWFETKRKVLFRLMFGLNDSALMELKRTGGRPGSAGRLSERAHRVDEGSSLSSWQLRGAVTGLH